MNCVNSFGFICDYYFVITFYVEMFDGQTRLRHRLKVTGASKLLLKMNDETNFWF